MHPNDYRDARSIDASLKAQLRNLERLRDRAHPEQDLDGIDEAIAELEHQLTEGEYI